MTPRVQPPDLEAWLVAHIRTELEATGLDVEVDNKEPADLRTPLEVPLVVVRDDSGARTSVIIYARQIGISVLAGTRQNDAQARTMSRLVYAIATEDEIALAAGSPIAAVIADECNGPYAVADDHDVARRYMTVGYRVVGSWD